MTPHEEREPAGSNRVAAPGLGGSRHPDDPGPADPEPEQDAVPTPLRRPRQPTPYPVDALPGWVADWVDAESIATQTPPDLAGCCALGVLSACAGGRAVVQARPGWREPTNLYLLPVLPPASRKSAVIAAATGPLNAVERELAERARAEIEETSILRDVAQRSAEKAARAAANATPANRVELLAEVVAAAAAADAIVVPVSPRLIADDVTPEAIGSLLAAHGGRMAVISAEGGVFDVMAGRYSDNVPNLDVWLKGHAGDTIRVDRKGRPPEYVPSPALTLLLTVQPVVLRALARNGTFRGRGLTARYLYAIPPDNVGQRDIGAPPVPDDVAATWDKRVRQLAVDMAAWTDPAVLTLSTDTHDLLLDLERDIEPRLRTDGDYGPIREWAGKLAGAVVRIAGLLHLAAAEEAVRTPIPAETFAAATRIGRYHVEHALAAHGLLGVDDDTDAVYLLDHITRRGHQEVSVRSLTTDLPRGRFGEAETVKAAVDVLVDHGWLIPAAAPARTGPGRRPSPRYRVHPSVTDRDSETRL